MVGTCACVCVCVSSEIFVFDEKGREEDCKENVCKRSERCEELRF